ncbi:FIST C-terminal domain-containing protein [Christensenellaceae bacterium OttesenSCG-928-M15]|nr:FIST C-terminal domain-containing protein [Christensenellaceae bacterium OttesenSCG-928-M15]
MIKNLVAYTGEIDDAQVAVEEILGQLDLVGRQLKNSVGIIACHYEFVLSGVAKAICEALPFTVAGTITSAQAVKEESGTLLLTLMVLTSDDVRFVAKLTEPLLEEPGKKIADAYKEAAGAEKPALILTYAPFMVQNSGDEYVNVLTEASSGVPCFGTLAVDDTADFSNCFLLYNGEHYRERMGMILLYGDLNPRFFIATISKSKILDKAALVTKSAGHILMEVNGRPVVEYFEDLGLTKASETSYAMTSLPFMLDYGDGTPPVSKVFIGLTPEKYAICAGAMPEGAKLYIGVFDKQDVLVTTGEAVDQALADISGASGLLIYSCISRNMSMGSDLLAELDLIREKAGEKLPFMMAYSGGEICPTQVSDDKAINRFHNNAFVACVF